MVRDYLECVAEHVPVYWPGPRIHTQIPARFIPANGCRDGYTLRPRQGSSITSLSQLRAFRIESS